MKCKRTSDGRKLDHHTLQVMREQAVKALLDGQPAAEIATAFGMNIRTIFKWCAKFEDGGQEALQAKPISGRPPKISEEEMQWIAGAVQDNTSQQFGFEFGLWTLSLLRELIKCEFGKSLVLESVKRIMILMGFSAQKPLYQAWQQDPELVKKWETETYPTIKEEARAAGANVYFADEAGIRTDYHTGTTWAPVGETPVVTGDRPPFLFQHDFCSQPTR